MGDAIVEIEITPPRPHGTRPWWLVTWDGTSATVRTAPQASTATTPTTGGSPA